MNIREAFGNQAENCWALGSPFMGRFMALVASRLTAGNSVTDRIFNWQGDASANADNVPLRLAGALHALYLTDQAFENIYPPADVSGDEFWAAVEQALEDHSDHILEWLDSPPQTNEVRRASVILPALALVEQRIGGPIDLIEVGASGGLNLRANHFRVNLPGMILGKEASTVVLNPEWRGPPPPPKLPNIRKRVGVDLAPIDPLTDEGALRLLSYLWADQPDRIERTRAAIDISGKVPAELVQADVADFLEETLALRSDNLRVVLHTIAWQYFPEEVSLRAEAALTSNAPLIRIGMEYDGGHGAGVRITWPDGSTEEIARADFHGRWVDWLVA